MSVLSDLFVAAGLGRAGVVPAGLSFSIGGVSDIWWGIVMTIVSAMSFMMSCAGVLVKSMRASNDVVDEVCGVERARWKLRIRKMVDFIKELEAMSGVDVAVKTAEFLNDVLWKDERRLQREITENLRLVREINALCARVTAIVDQREMFVDELDMLAGRHVPDKMANFMKQIQGKDIPNLMKLQILGREFELRDHEKGIFTEKLKGDLDY
nr:hypothetical protein [Tanacetum cinerariifolium]